MPTSFEHCEAQFPRGTIEEKPMLKVIVGVLIVLWLLGFVGHIGGGLIHLLLVIAAVVFVFDLLAGRTTV